MRVRIESLRIYRILSTTILLLINMAEKNAIFLKFEGAEIWNHYKKSKCGKFAECQICTKILKCDGGSTKGLHVHLKSVHKIDLIKRKIGEGDSLNNTKKPSAVKKLDFFMADSSLPAVLARMTACDGFSFKIFITSQDLRKSLTALGHSLPKSATVIRELVMQYGRHLREKVFRSLSHHKSMGEKFCLTLDEWTSLQNKRYININIHGKGYFWNLGLFRIRGRFSAEVCSSLISEKLSEFGINFKTDIVAITTDGCSMMKKLGRISPPFQQLCYAHGLQLVIQDVFYCKQSTNTSELYDTSETEEDEISSDDEESSGLTVLNATDLEIPIELSYDIFNLVRIVRQIVKLFKRSPLKNETLQKYVKENYPNGLNLILDCKTRWSSLLDMLERIIKIKLPVQKALLDLGVQIHLSDLEFFQIESITEALSPMKIAIKALCRRDANLITAEATIKFLFDELKKSPSYYNTRILEAIDQRIVQERYTDASVIIQYLHNPRAQLGKKAVINKFCCELLSRMEEHGKETLSDGMEITDATENSYEVSQFKIRIISSRTDREERHLAREHLPNALHCPTNISRS